MINLLRQNKKITIPLLALGLIILIVLLNLTLKELSKVSVIFQSDITDSKLQLIDKDSKVISEFETPFKARLKQGIYYIKALNQQKYSSLPQQINIVKSDTVTLNIEYSSDYYDKTFSQDRETINDMLQKSYSKTLSSMFFTIAPGKFFDRGKYFATSIGLIDNSPDGGSGSFVGTIYHVIFKKQDNSWKQVTHPEPIISAITYKDVPDYIIKEVNNWRY